MTYKVPTEEETREHFMGPRPGVEGIFREHNCAMCNDGAKPCIRGHAKGREWSCEFPHARND